MKDSRIIKLIRILSKKELRDLRKFLHSPFFNQREDLIQLYELLLKTPTEKLAKEGLYQQLFPDTTYDVQKLRLLLTYLLRLIEQFLHTSHYLGDQTAQQEHLVRALRHHQEGEAYQRSLEQAIRQLDKQPFRNEDYWHQKNRLSWENYRLESKVKPQQSLNLQNISDDIDIAYFAAKLRLASFALAQQSVYTKVHIEPRLLQNILQTIESGQLLDIPVIRSYFYCYKMLQSTSAESYFSTFKQTIIQSGEHFPVEEIRDLYLLAINFCIRQVNGGHWDQRFFYEVLELYKTGIKEGYLLENGVLSRFTYYNAVVAAFKVKELDYAEEFIETYRDSLEKRYRNSAYSFNRARLAFERKNYDEALQRLQTSNYRDVLLNLSARIMSIKIYYETKEWSLLEAQIEATKLYLRRKKVVAYHRDLLRSFLRYTQALLTINHYDRTAMNQLATAIRQDATLTEKEWLLEQLNLS